jgi:hypothetical protein
MTKLIFTLRDFANAPETHHLNLPRPYLSSSQTLNCTATRLGHNYQEMLGSNLDY